MTRWSRDSLIFGPRKQSVVASCSYSVTKKDCFLWEANRKQGKISIAVLNGPKELRMYNPEYLERPYVVVLNKIDLPEARDRLPSLVHEISTMGCPEGPSSKRPGEALQASEIEGPNASIPLLESLSKERKEKKIEDYPRPLAVVGVSVLKGIGINEMLKEIRAALQQCQDLDKVADLSIV
ncbi:hypothetical protein ACLOJK_031758 [Asimina triloba]